MSGLKSTNHMIYNHTDIAQLAPETEMSRRGG